MTHLINMLHRSINLQVRELTHLYNLFLADSYLSIFMFHVLYMFDECVHTLGETGFLSMNCI
jgi:hypothetical protein